MDLQFNTNAYTTAAGQAEISGLPFPAAVMDGAMMFGTFSLITYTANAQDLRLRMVSGGSIARVQLTASNAAFANAGVANFPASKTGILIRATGMYWTNA